MVLNFLIKCHILVRYVLDRALMIVLNPFH